MRYIQFDPGVKLLVVYSKGVTSYRENAEISMGIKAPWAHNCQPITTLASGVAADCPNAGPCES